MESIYHPVAPRYDDHTAIRANGMWYQSWQSGYGDIIKRGFPKPSDDRVVLAELHSPLVPCFLHGWSGDIPFLVSEKARKAIEDGGLTGFKFGPVVVAKIATLGKRKRKAGSGEPEDAILKSKGIGLDAAPKLHSVKVTARVPAKPDHESGRHPKGWVSPFDLALPSQPPDLFRPELQGQLFPHGYFVLKGLDRVTK